MSTIYKTIDDITRTKTAVDGTERIPCRDDNGDFKITIGNLISVAMYPIGSFYVQYPDAASNDDAIAFPVSARPATMFGGTWVEQFAGEGTVFQTAGYNGLGRTNGLMADQMQGHYHGSSYLAFNTAAVTAAFGSFCTGGVTPVSTLSPPLSILGPTTDGTNGTPRTGTKTSHTNRLAKYWKRTVL